MKTLTKLTIAAPLAVSVAAPVFTIAPEAQLLAERNSYVDRSYVGGHPPPVTKQHVALVWLKWQRGRMDRAASFLLKRTKRTCAKTQRRTLRRTCRDSA